MRFAPLLAALLLTPTLACAAGAGQLSVTSGRAGLVIRGKASGSDALVPGILAGAAILIGAGQLGRSVDAFADERAYLLVDATPPEAQVFLDGRPLGPAGQLVARAVPLARGRHAVEVVAQGFEPYGARFTADPSFPIRLRVTLAPSEPRRDGIR